MIEAKDMAHAWVYTNTRDVADTSGIIAAVILCFKSTPESRATLWLAKDESGAYKFMVPHFPITIAKGEKMLTVLYGKIVDDMVIWAERARARLKKDLADKGQQMGYGKVYKVTGQGSEEMPQ